MILDGNVPPVSAYLDNCNAQSAWLDGTIATRGNVQSLANKMQMGPGI